MITISKNRFLNVVIIFALLYPTGSVTSSASISLDDISSWRANNELLVKYIVQNSTVKPIIGRKTYAITWKIDTTTAANLALLGYPTILNYLQLADKLENVEEHFSFTTDTYRKHVYLLSMIVSLLKKRFLVTNEQFSQINNSYRKFTALIKDSSGIRKTKIQLNSYYNLNPPFRVNMSLYSIRVKDI